MSHDDRGSALHRCLTCRKSQCEHGTETLHHFWPEPFRCAVHFACYADRVDCIDTASARVMDAAKRGAPV